MSNAMVPELLKPNLSNYDDWKIWMENYFRGQGLWNIVEGKEGPSLDDFSNVAAAWEEKNAKALHVIQICCGSEMFPRIKDLKSAKEAWDCLGKEHSKMWYHVKRQQEMYYSLQELGENVGEGLSRYQELYNAALNDDEEMLSTLLTTNKEATSAKVDMFSNTALHIAVTKGNEKCVKTLLKHSSEQDLRIQNCFGQTAFHLASLSGKIEIVNELLKTNIPELLLITESTRSNTSANTPLILAAFAGRKDVIVTLYQHTEIQDLKLDAAEDLLELLINADIYDVALDLIHKCTELSKSVESWKKALYHLAERPHAFQSGNHLGFWDRQIYQWIQVEQECNGYTQLNCFFWKSLAQIEPSLKKVWEKKLMHIQAHTLLEHLVHKVIKLDNQLEVAKLLASSLSVAAKFGVVEFFNVVFQSYPPMLGYFGYTMLSILQNAIVNRQAKIFQFLKKTFGSAIAIGNYRDTSKDTILHSAAKLSTSPQLNSIPGAALRMQSELQWFKEVEKIVPPHFGNLKNSEDMTAQAVFTKEHKHLVVEGEKWMKETATSCSLIAVLIVTVAFAAGFTVPGGYKDNQGIPVFLRSNSFKVFAISDALAFFSSTASLLMFLSIFTTRYTEETFLNALPRKLIFGIMMLFLSVAATMVAFSGGYIIMLDNQFPLVVVLLALLAFAPVTVLALLHIPLFVEVVLSTYRHPFY